MFILWFGIGEEFKIIIIILVFFFLIFLNILKGIKNCDNKLIEVGKFFNLFKKRIFYKIIIFNFMLDIVVGFSLGFGYSFRVIIGVEFIVVFLGLGYLIFDGKDMFRIDVVLVGIFVIGFLGIFLDYLFLKIIIKFSKGK